MGITVTCAGPLARLSTMRRVCLVVLLVSCAVVLAESESQAALEQSGKCNAKTLQKAGEKVCEAKGSARLGISNCKAAGCCIWDKSASKCFFCGDLAHDPGCGGDGVGFVKNAKGVYVKKGTEQVSMDQVVEEDDDAERDDVREDREGDDGGD